MINITKLTTYYMVWENKFDKKNYNPCHTKFQVIIRVREKTMAKQTHVGDALE